MLLDEVDEGNPSVSYDIHASMTRLSSCFSCTEYLMYPSLKHAVYLLFSRYQDTSPFSQIPLTAQHRQIILQDLVRRYELESVIQLEDFHRRGLATFPRLFDWWMENLSEQGGCITEWAVEEAHMTRFLFRLVSTLVSRRLGK